MRLTGRSRLDHESIPNSIRLLTMPSLNQLFPIKFAIVAFWERYFL